MRLRFFFLMDMIGSVVAAGEGTDLSVSRDKHFFLDSFFDVDGVLGGIGRF
jgi:hypothetical protein